MTPLAQYLKNQNGSLTRSAFAGRVGISPSYLTELAAGIKRPSLDVACRIERETGGAVKVAHWLEAAR